MTLKDLTKKEKKNIIRTMKLQLLHLSEKKLEHTNHCYTIGKAIFVIDPFCYI